MSASQPPHPTELSEEQLSAMEVSPPSLQPPVEKQSLLSWLQTHWESATLAGVILAMLSCLAMVLWPAPDTVLTLHEVPLNLPAASVQVAPEANSVEQNETVEDEAVIAAPEPPLSQINQAHKRAVHHFAPKKPKHPPITSLNKANLAQLQLLPGLGPKMAQRVVDYRHSHGPFTDPAQIMDVKGIGPKKYEKMRPFIKL